ncbi:hypothetical protein AURDEDRAFT_168080 [Auricularia subglabra TFB-10046 SS5]|nr:hypothetical protein AURDEDRAFT_168080 [Auricularia subglabra TFB-10046 SS5]
MPPAPIILTRPDELPNGYCQMISLAWFIYDYALTFDDEFRYIWRRKVTWSSVVFLLTRYLAGLMLVLSALTCTIRGFTTTQECSLFDWFEGIGTFVLFFFVQGNDPAPSIHVRLSGAVILQSRLYVMYNRSRRLLLFNACLMVVEHIVSGTVMVLYYRIEQPVIVPPWTLGSCFNERPQVFAAVWAAPLAFESYLAILAVRKIVEEHSLLRNTSSLMSLMVRDNIVYFFIIVLAMIVNVVVYGLDTGLNPGVSVTTIVHAAGAIGGTRIILSLLRNADDVLHSSTRGTSTGTRIVFRRGDLESVTPSNPAPLPLRPSASNLLGTASRVLAE